MAELLLLRGIPASGKSTFARAWANAGPNRVLVSRDAIRFAMFGRYDNCDEKLVTAVEDRMVMEALNARKSVCVDDCNIDQKYVTRLAQIGHKHNAHVTLHQFPIDLATAKRRNANRDRVVPENVLESMYSRFVNNQDISVDPEPGTRYEPVPGSPKAIIVDIDGTIAERETGGRGPYDWKRVGEDYLVEEVVKLVNWYSEDGCQVIVMSGRDAVCWSETVEWLNKHDIPWNELYMRPENDGRKDSVVKRELFDKHVRPYYNVEVVLDDRQQVVDMWRDLGLRVFQVAPGQF